MSKHLEQTSVVIIGGGLVGLSAALFLSHHNVPCILLEKHSHPSPHPRAIGYTTRTMEIFNTVGITSQIPQVPKDFRLRRIQVESLVGKWDEEALNWNPAAADDKNPREHEEETEYSPFCGAALAQDRLEPILREKALTLGADIRAGAKMTEFQQDSNGVDVSVTTAEGNEYRIHASYMLAADGHRSAVRSALGIKTSGRGHLNTVRSVLFRAALSQYQQGFQQFVIRQPSLQAFLTTYGDDRWVLMFTDDIERSISEQERAIRAAVGIPDLDFEILTTGRWELKAEIADTYHNGRVFLAGDAAHTLPPTRGGYGANTGIADAHNLAWKLAAVLRGKCGDGLLETYAAERRPVAWLRHQQTFARMDYKLYRVASDDETVVLDDVAIELGQRYASECVIEPDDEEVEETWAKVPSEWEGRPGTRAPHAWLTSSSGKEGKRISSLELFDRNWTLVTEDTRWREVVKDTMAPLKVSCVVLNSGDEFSEDDSFCRMLGLTRGGASLIRPDGYVAWSSKAWPEEPQVLLCQVRKHLAGI